MKNWINRIPKEKLQRYIFLGMLILVFVAFFISLTLIDQNGPDQNDNNDDNQNDVDDDDDDDTEVRELFKLPVESGKEYVVVRRFYDKNAATADQELAIIQFGSTYVLSKGIAISAKDEQVFNVVSCLSGVVDKVEDSPIYGTVVTIKHSDDVYTEYSSLASAAVDVGDTVKQGDVIGVSGENEFDQLSKIHVFVKVTKDGKNYDPTKLLGKEAEDFE